MFLHIYCSYASAKLRNLAFSLFFISLHSYISAFLSFIYMYFCFQLQLNLAFVFSFPLKDFFSSYRLQCTNYQITFHHQRGLSYRPVLILLEVYSFLFLIMIKHSEFFCNFISALGKIC